MQSLVLLVSTLDQPGDCNWAGAAPLPADGALPGHEGQHPGRHGAAQRAGRHDAAGARPGAAARDAGGPQPPPRAADAGRALQGTGEGAGHGGNSTEQALHGIKRWSYLFIYDRSLRSRPLQMLRAVSEGLVGLLLDPSDYGRPAARVVVREVLAGAVLRPLMMWATPYDFNRVRGGWGRVVGVPSACVRALYSAIHPVETWWGHRPSLRAGWPGRAAGAGAVRAAERPRAGAGAGRGGGREPGGDPRDGRRPVGGAPGALAL